MLGNHCEKGANWIPQRVPVTGLSLVYDLFVSRWLWKSVGTERSCMEED